MDDQTMIRITPEEQYLARSEEHAYISNITNLIVGPRTTDLQFEYEMPPQRSTGKVRIWAGMTVDFTQEPFYEADLESYKGQVTVSTAATNFNRGAYTVTVSADGDLHSIAATSTLLNGQPVAAGSSFIAVTSKQSTYISTLFQNPPNLTAYKEADWAVIYQGAELGQGTRLADATAPLDETSGMITVPFEAGTLVSGQTYNVCLSVGNYVPTISAAYVFKYLLL